MFKIVQVKHTQSILRRTEILNGKQNLVFRHGYLW